MDLTLSKRLVVVTVVVMTGSQAAKAEDRPALNLADDATATHHQPGCPQLFGDEQLRFQHKAFREKILLWTVEEPAGITVVHSHQGWEDVTAFRIAGVELLERTDEGAQAATIQLTEPLAQETGCPPGRYRVRQDDALGKNASVLAIFRTVVLIALDGQLGYLPVADAPRPTWLVAWHLPGVTFHPQSTNSATRSPSPPKQKPRPKPKAAKPRRRKR